MSLRSDHPSNSDFSLEKIYTSFKTNMHETYGIRDKYEYFGEYDMGSKINSMIISKDGKYIITGDDEGLLKVYLMETKQLFHVFNKNSDDVILSVAGSHDAKYIVSGHINGKVKLWDLESRILVHSFDHQHDEKIYSVAISPDGLHILSACEDKSIKAWSSQAKQILHTFPNAHLEPVLSVCFSADGKFFVSGSRDGTIKEWDFVTKELRHDFQNAHSKPVCSIAISPDMKHIVSGSKKDKIKIWSTETKQKVHELDHQENGNIAPVHCVSFSSDGKYLLTGSSRTLNLWNFDEKNLIHHFHDAHKDQVTSVEVFGHHIVSASLDRKMAIWDLNSSNRVHVFQSAHTDGIKNMDISPDGKCVLSMSKDCVKYWSIESRKLIKTFDFEAVDVMFTPNGKRFIFIDASSVSNIVDIKEKSIVDKIEHVQAPMLFSPKGDYLFFKDEKTSKIVMWQLDQKKIIHEFDHDSVKKLAISSDGKYLITTDLISTIKLWDLQDKKLLHMIDNPSPQHVAISQDGNFFVAALRAGISLCKLGGTFDLISSFTLGDNMYLSSLVIAPDNRYIAFSTQERDIHLWSTEAKKFVKVIKRAFDDSITKLAISSKGKYLVAGSTDCTLKRWDLEPELLIPDALNSAIESIAITPDSKFLIASSGEATKVWDFNTNNFKYSFKGALQLSVGVMKKHNETAEVYVLCGIFRDVRDTVHLWNLETQDLIFKVPDSQKVFSSAISKHADYFVIGDEEGSIKLWHLESEKLVHLFVSAHKNRVTTLVFTPDGKKFISSSDDFSIKIWDVDTKMELFCFENAHKSSIRSISVSSDCKYLATIADGESYRLWDLETYQLMNQNSPNDYSFSSVAISIESNLIISNIHDRLEFWNLQTGMLLHQIHSEQMISKISVSADGKYLVCGYYNKSIKYLKLPSFYFILSKDKGHISSDIPQSSELNELKKESQFLIAPYNWNQYHRWSLLNYCDSQELLFPRKNSKDVDLLSEIINLKAQIGDNETRRELFLQELFQMDIYGNLPLDYVDYLGDKEHFINELTIQSLQIFRGKNPIYFAKLMKNLSYRFVGIMKKETKNDVNLVKELLDLSIDSDCSMKEFDEYNFTKKRFGTARNKILKHHNYSWGKNKLEHLADISNETHTVKYLRTMMPLDLELGSAQGIELCQFLFDENKRFLLEHPYIQLVLDYFWNHSKYFHWVLVITHTVFLVLLTIEAANSESEIEGIQVILLLLTIVMLIFEIFHLSLRGFSLALIEIWAILDLTSYSFTIITVLSLLANKAEEAIPYLKSVALISGYFRWLGYLRIFDGMRSLIRTIIEIFKDIKNFLIVLLLTVLLYSTVLESFNYGDSLYLSNIYNAYFFIYDSKLEGDMKTGLQIITMVFPLIINVVFLNMLISIMGDTFDKIQEKSVSADNLEKVSLILESNRFFGFLKSIRSKKKILFSKIESKNAAIEKMKLCCKKRNPQPLSRSINLPRKKAATTNTENHENSNTSFIGSSRLAILDPALRGIDLSNLPEEKNVSKDAIKQVEVHQISELKVLIKEENRKAIKEIENYINARGRHEEKVSFLFKCENIYDELETDWAGKMAFLSKQIEIKTNEIKTQNVNLEQMMTKNKSEMTEMKDEIAKLKDEFAEIMKDQIDKIMKDQMAEMKDQMAQMMEGMNVVNPNASKSYELEN